jgi:hypothetical protein
MPKLTLPPITKGIIRDKAVDSVLVPPDSVQFLKNLHTDVYGALTLRKGMTTLGAQISAGNPVLGMTNYRNNAGTTFQALAKVANDVYAFNGTSWSSVRSSLTVSSKARFTSLVDYVFMVNGNGNEALQTYNGSGNFGTTNAASLPKGDLIETFRSRIWVGDSSNDRVYYSDVVTTSNTITGGTSFLQISPADGENVTGLKRHPRALLVFKQNHIYRIFSIDSTDPDPAFRRGTYSNESIIECKSGIYYHHSSGFYRFEFETEQEEISRPIIDIVQAIPRSYYGNITGWDDDDHLYWSIGDITLEGVSFTNIICVYTISTQNWTVYSTSSEIRSAALYDDGTNLFDLVGDDNGNVLKFNEGTTDNGGPIHYDLITHWLYLSEIKTSRKSVTELATLHENAHGGNLSYQLDSDSPNKWRPIGTIKKDLEQIDSLNARSFKRIKFRFYGSSSGTPFTFRGWELLNLLIEGETKNA